MDRLPTWPVAAGSLLLGFGVAQATGVRPLGGLVLVAAAAWCMLRWWRAAGVARAAVLLAAGVSGLAAWALADGRLPRQAAAA